MGLSMVAVFLFSDTMSTSGIVGSQRHTVERHPAVRVVLHLRDRGGRRDQPRAVRPARGRVRTGRRLPHRVLVVQVRDVLPRRVHQHGHRLGAGHHAVPRRLAGAVAAARSGTAPTPAGGRCSGSSPRSSSASSCFVWLRGTLPRLRYDQFMHFGWKVLIPINLVWILAVTVDPRAARPRLAERGRPTACRWRSCCWSSSCPALMMLGGASAAPGRRTRRGGRGRGRSWPPTFPIPPHGPRRARAAAPAGHVRAGVARRRPKETPMADRPTGRRRRATG